MKGRRERRAEQSDNNHHRHHPRTGSMGYLLVRLGDGGGGHNKTTIKSVPYE